MKYKNFVLTIFHGIWYAMAKDVVSMAYSKAQMRASNKYRAKAYDVIQTTVPKGKRDEYKAQAAAHGLSLNAYIISLLEADKTPARPVLSETVSESEKPQE